jgi:hypothetical protein
LNNILEKIVTLREFINNKYSEDEIKEIVHRNDITIFPEIYKQQNSINYDLIDLIKLLRENGFNIHIIGENNSIIDKREADLILNLGIISATLLAPILGVVAKFLMEKYSHDQNKNVNIRWYSNKKEKMFSYSGSIKHFLDILKEFKDDT